MNNTILIYTSSFAVSAIWTEFFGGSRNGLNREGEGDKAAVKPLYAIYQFNVILSTGLQNDIFLFIPVH